MLLVRSKRYKNDPEKEAEEEAEKQNKSCIGSNNNRSHNWPVPIEKR
jgi:hypothetical protein